MTTAIIISLCSLLLIAYLFDLTSSKTKIPSVILLLLLGWTVRQLTVFFHVQLPDFSDILPLLGTLGLILIVLEGSLELKISKSKFGMISKSFAGALLSMFALVFSLAYLFHDIGGYSLKNSLLNAIPFCIISSAIAIPSARNLSLFNREFIIYESSLSDIFGILLFNFIALNEVINLSAFGEFGLQLLIIIVISFIFTIGLAFLLSLIKHHIKFIPIMILVILIYAVSKAFHLPALVFIIVFGLFIGNILNFKRLSWTKRFKIDELNKEVIKFREITIEATFLIRVLFFLLFGYLIETADVLNINTLSWSVGIVIAIFVFRLIQLILSKLPISPLIFVAPRGLITILLFLSIAKSQSISIVNRPVIIQVIIITAFVMMIGLMITKKTKENPPDDNEIIDVNAITTPHIVENINIDTSDKTTF